MIFGGNMNTNTNVECPKQNMHLEEKCQLLNLLLIPFHMNHSVIKRCALTPPTGHYNSNTSYNFSEFSYHLTPQIQSI